MRKTWTSFGFEEVPKDLGLLIGKGGLYRNILRIKLPLCITKADVDFIIQVLDFAFSSYGQE